MLSSLMLANYEQQMQFDPTATISSTNIALWENSRKSNSEECKQKVKSSATENAASSTNSESHNNDSIKSNNSSSLESDEEIFHIDPYVSRLLFPIKLFMNE